MDRRERLNNPQVALQLALDGLQAQIWTALPVIIESFNPAAMTCTAQCAVQYAHFPIEGGQPNWIDIPLLLDCPVIFPSGGGFSLTFPISPGNEALAVFSSRCIDSWWKNGGTKNRQPLIRMHDLSDGFVLVGVRSQPNVLPSISTTSVQLRSDDGATNIDLKGGVVTVNASQTVVNSITTVVNATNGMTVNGNLSVTGDIIDNSATNSSSMAHMRAVFDGHDHVDPQGGVVSPPSIPM